MESMYYDQKYDTDWLFAPRTRSSRGIDFVFDISRIPNYQIESISQHRYCIEYSECKPISREEVSDMTIRKTISLWDESSNTISYEEYSRQESGMSLSRKSPEIEHQNQQQYTLEEHLEEWRREVSYPPDHHREYPIIWCISWEFLIDPVTDSTET